MTRRFLSTAITLAALLSAAACERAPTAPNFDVEALIAGTDPALKSDLKPVASTLPALFREAIAKTEAEQGRVGVQALLSRWRGLQDELKDGATSADRAAVQAKVDAIHEEELNVVLRGLGNNVLTRVMSELSLDAANARSQIAEGGLGSADSARAIAVAAQVTQKIAGARAAILLGHEQQALDMASQAATLLSGLDYYLIELQRINGLETLYPRAIDKLKAQGNRDLLSGISAVERASLAARDAMSAGDRGAAQDNLVRARNEQIQVVLKVLGPRAVQNLVTQVAVRTTQLRDSINTLAASGKDVVRYQRMLLEANDLAKRARAASDAGDAATALDLGSHAAGLLNALQHLTWK